MMRRLGTVLVLVFLEPWPFFQSTFMMVFSTLNLVNLIANRPLLSKMENRTELFNEFCIAIFSHLMTTLINVAIPDSLKEKLGLALIIVCSFNMASNLVLIVFNSIVGTFTDFRDSNAKKKVFKVIKKRDKMRHQLVEKHNLKLEHFQEQQNYVDKIEDVKAWHLERRWLVKNKCDLTELKEEESF